MCKLLQDSLRRAHISPIPTAEQIDASNKQDTLLVLPIGSDKSLAFQALSALLKAMVQDRRCFDINSRY